MSTFLANRRPQFDEIVNGWMLVHDFDTLTERIELIVDWLKAWNGPLLSDELATVKLMIQTQIAWGIEAGHFDFLIDMDIPATREE